MEQSQSYAIKKLVIIGLSLVGVIVSFVLVLRSQGYGAAEQFCGMSSAFDCKRVTESSWSNILGLDLSRIALAFYLFSFFLSLIALIKKSFSFDYYQRLLGSLFLLSFLTTCFLLPYFKVYYSSLLSFLYLALCT